MDGSATGVIMNLNRRLAAAAAFTALTFGATLAVAPTSAGAHDGGHPEPVPAPAPAPAPAGELTGPQRQVIRDATKALRDPAAAQAAGYQPTEACAAVPGVGAMGQHWVNPTLLLDGGRIDPTMPEVLLFAPAKNGRLELVGVEYMAFIAPGQLEAGDPAPTMLGHQLDGPMPGHEPGMPVHFDLHAWVYANNPSGDLAPWNPKVSCEVGR